MRVLVTSPHARVVRRPDGTVLRGGDPNSGAIAVALASALRARGITVTLLDGRDFPECARTADEAAELERQDHSRHVVPVDYNRWQRRHTAFGRSFAAASADYHIDVHSCPPRAFGVSATVMATTSPTNKAFETRVAETIHARVVNAEHFMRDNCADSDCTGLLVNAKPETPAVAIEFAAGGNHSAEIAALANMLHSMF